MPDGLPETLMAVAMIFNQNGRFRPICLALLLWFATAQGLFSQVQIASPQRLAEFRQALPEVADRDLAKILADPATIFYDQQSMPAAYQLGNGSTSFHSPLFNISGDPSDNQKPHGLGGNGNVDFPWRFGVPGGTQRCSGVSSFKFISLPHAPAGRFLPVVWWKQTLPDPLGETRGYSWTFPVGTVFGEVITQRSPSGHDVVFEIRTRRRERDFWDVDVFRPFGTPKELTAALRKVKPDVSEKLCWQIENMPASQVGELSDAHPQHAFVARSAVVGIPALGSEETVNSLLQSTPFRSVLGGEWTSGVAAPTVDSGYNIVPARYDGAFVGADDQSCAKCHDSALKAAREFDRRRGWYGFVRGSDGILSWHPVEPSSISYNGGRREFVLRRKFVEARIVERYDSAKHPGSVYNRIKGLR